MPNFSFWETDSFFHEYDYVIIGSGITGLSTAISLKEKNRNLKILILEKGLLPQGASTKNAGFCCFGSLSELVDDFSQNSLESVVNLAEKRYKGLLKLRKRVGDSNLQYLDLGSYELFNNKEEGRYKKCLEYLETFNKEFNQTIGKDVYSLANEKINNFGFDGVQHLIYNRFEGQIHTGEMMKNLLKIARNLDVEIFTSISCLDYEDTGQKVKIKTDRGIEIISRKLIIATNGFASNLIDEKVEPARAQVLITKPIHNLKFKGTFHCDRGYYYFRNVGDRVLFGGGRNINFQEENTEEFGLTKSIQDSLETMLSDVILPQTPFEIESRWSGIMGVGNSKEPIVKWISDHVICGVRLGGMGVAIGSLLGEELAVKALSR